MGDYWQHEIRIGQRLSAEEDKHYSVCTGGSGSCSSEDWGGSVGYLHRRDEASSYKAMKDFLNHATFDEPSMCKS